MRALAFVSDRGLGFEEKAKRAKSGFLLQVVNDRV